ncbi:hypothetical protein [Paenibacillus elgii]|uniref:hypothetical protein n=1 Tax=Paenibacillus elgii TaxID=189691 RepID=UPI000248CB79|nr:hypothetical protein [Paenibacillus elgii]
MDTDRFFNDIALLSAVDVYKHREYLNKDTYFHTGNFYGFFALSLNMVKQYYAREWGDKEDEQSEDTVLKDSTLWTNLSKEPDQEDLVFLKDF